ncbi:MAG: ATP-dependent helicase UvrD/PcrA [Clostridiales bacterium]|jgi:DNA helicase-2/ATP-dependent DNA helicase PcrA|nr:ATP-dependent helicase UvrD/PcrA [Clostridiales bacterium]MDN5281046.1 ATP-dependent helicase UvrD/PcrA [Candidatus Ozemobacter sp.]
MFPADTKILCGDKNAAISEIREESAVSGASGWGEVNLTRVKDVFVNYDHKTSLCKIATTRGAVIRCSPEQLCFGRINPLVRHYSLYLHERSSLGFRIGTSPDLMRDLLAMNNLKQDLFNQQEIIDRIWIIETTANLPNATFMEKYSMFKYGLPNVPFSSRQPDSELSDDMIRELFNSIDTPSRAHDLLRDWHMFIDHPHITMRLSNSSNPTSNSIQFVLFGGTERADTSGRYSHLIQISSPLDPNRAEHRQFKRKQGKHGLWYLEITRDDLDEAELFVKTLSHLDSLEVVKKIQLTRKSPFYILPASHLKPGMLVPILNRKGVIDEDTVASVEMEEYKGPLYNLQTHNLHNFIVGQWVVMCYDFSQSLQRNTSV